MRKIVALAALLAWMPVANAADNKGELTMNGEYRVRYQHDQAWGADKDANTNKNTVNHRFKLDNAFKVSEKFGAHLTLIHNAIWGNFNSSTDSGTAIPDGTADGQNMVLVNQAYGTWMLNDTWTLKFGRGGFTMADGSVISQNDWEATPYAFDGVLANYEHEMFRLSLFGVKAIDNVPAANIVNGNEDPETNFFGFALDWKSLPEFLKMANLHLLQVNKDEVTGFTPAVNASQNQMRYGIVLGGDVAGVDYKINYAAHNGEGHLTGNKFDIEGNMMAAEVGYSMPEMMKSRFSVAYHQDSGDKKASATPATDKQTKYDAFFTEKHNSAGMMDVLAWGNLTFIKAAYTMSPMDQVEVGLQYWKFTTTENNDNAEATAGANGGTGATGLIPNARTATKNSDDLGSEIDLSVSKKYDGGFAINAWVGMYMPGKYTKDELAKDDTYNMVFVEGKMSF